MMITLRSLSHLSGFSKGTYYRPLEVYFNDNSKKFRLINDNNDSPGIYDGADFNVIDPRFYADWIMAVQGKDSAILSSKEFLEPGYWESYFDNKPEALQNYNRILNPLAQTSLSLDFVRRIKNIPWETVHVLVQNAWLKPALATHLAIPRLDLPQTTEMETELASLGVRDSARVMEILTFLSPNGGGKREAALLLAAWGYENRSILRDPILFLEDIYLKCFPAEELKAAMPFLNPKIPNEDILVNWKCILDAYVYNKVLVE